MPSMDMIKKFAENMKAKDLYSIMVEAQKELKNILPNIEFKIGKTKDDWFVFMWRDKSE